MFLYQETYMVRVVTFIYSDDVKFENSVANPAENKPNTAIINPLLMIRPPFIPCLYSFSISLGIQGFDPTQSNTLRIVFSKTDGEILVDSENVNLQIDNAPSDLPTHLRGVMFNMDFRNVVMQHNGTYQTEVFFNGESLGIYPIEVWGKNNEQYQNN